MLNLLMSYPYMSTDVMRSISQHQSDIRLLIDCGAFTDWKSGKETSVEDYMEFLESLPFKPWRYFVMDKIGDSEGTKKNYKIMLNRGFKPVPIFTRGSDIGDLDYYYETSDVVGIGGLVGTKNSRGYLKHVIGKNKNRSLHWLGLTGSSMVGYYKPFSCDASSWEGGGRYGQISVYMGKGVMKSYSKKDATKSAPTSEIWKVIRSYGFDPRELQIEKNWRGGWSTSRTLGCQSWTRYAIDVEKQFNTKLFLAVTTRQGVEMCLMASKKDSEVFA